MPIGALKNTLYGLALPIAAKRCGWREVRGGDAQTRASLRRVLKRNRTVGACIQRFSKGKPEACYIAGNAALEPQARPVEEETVFRTASVAKMVSALLVFRLQTLNRLSIYENISDFLGYQVRNPHFPDAPVTLGMLLGHTSGIVDSPAYFEAFDRPTDLSALLSDRAAYSGAIPGLCFRYSNLGAGMIGCLLEKRFGESLETLAQRELFRPLGVRATFDASTLEGEPAADGYRVLPFARCFDAKARISAALPLGMPNPERHYLLASGNLYLTAPELSKLTLTAWDGHDGFLDEESLGQMQRPVTSWPEKTVCMRHGMGLLQIDDARVCDRPLWGHQGFAYGAVNGVFFDADGNGFASLTSGASERRLGHLARLNMDLISLFFQ